MVVVTGIFSMTDMSEIARLAESCEDGNSGYGALAEVWTRNTINNIPATRDVIPVLGQCYDASPALASGTLSRVCWNIIKFKALNSLVKYCNVRFIISKINRNHSR